MKYSAVLLSLVCFAFLYAAQPEAPLVIRVTDNVVAPNTDEDGDGSAELRQIRVPMPESTLLFMRLKFTK